MNSILILTLQGADNHGAVLQNFALQTAVEDLGFQAKTLDYRCDSIDSAFAISIWPRKVKGVGKYLEKLSRNILNCRRMHVKRAAFQHFRDTYLTLTEEKVKQELSAVDGQYDVFMVGSDQVWNVDITGERDADTYTLQFVHSGKRAAYAASAGSSSNVTPALVERLSAFDYISVREHSLKEQLEQCGLTNIHDACDPVLLLERARWEQLLPIAHPREKPYVFVYYAGSSDIRRLSRDIAARRNLKIHHINRVQKKLMGFGTSRYGIGPVEFISYIAHAEAVVSPSFHALAFAILFEREFFIIHHASTGARTRDLLAALDLSDRGFDSYEDYCLRKDSIRPVNWHAVKEKLAGLRKTSQDVLRDICNLS